MIFLKSYLGGYKINSLFMNGGISPMVTENKDLYSQSGGNVSNIFNNLAVPAGLLLLQQKALKHYSEDKKDGVVSEDLFDKLLNLSSPNKSKKMTKRHKKSKNSKKTKRVNK